MVVSLDHEAPPRGIPPGPAPRRRMKLSTRNMLLGIVMILPAVITMIVVVAYPLAFGVSLGFFDVRLLTLDRTFVGLENFVEVLTGDAQFLSSLGPLAHLPPETRVLPSHERVFLGLHRRIAELHEHHDRRLERLLEGCERPITASSVRTS